MNLKTCLFDTHTHLDDARYKDDRDKIIEDLNESGIGLICNIGADMKGCENSIALAQKYPFIYATVGLHPYDAQEMTEAELTQLEKLAKAEKVVAIGEIGLDYHYENCNKEKQIYWFNKQMELAEKLNLPVVIHDRDAHNDTFNVLKQYPKVIGIMHCFSGSAEFAKEILKLGYYISFAGPLTYKNAKNVVSAAKIVPLDRVLVETDCPYLAPEGHRGQRNEPKFVEITCRKLAEIKEIPFEEMAKITMENGRSVFGI